MTANKKAFIFGIIASVLFVSPMVFGYEKRCGYQGSKDLEFYAGRASYSYVKDYTTRLGQDFVCYVNLDRIDRFNIQNVLTMFSGNTSIEIAENKLKYKPAGRIALKVLRHFKKYRNANTLADVLDELGMDTLEQVEEKRDYID